MIPKCGPIVCWHWAHRVLDCDPWSEPETTWHRTWKHHGYETEVVLRHGDEVHRADIVTITGLVIELQSGYLSADAIAARERFYGRMWWLYHATWTDRLHFGRYGFWWKHGAKSMARHERPVHWDLGDEVWLVSVGLSESGSCVLGKVLKTMTRRDFIRAIDHRYEGEVAS